MICPMRNAFATLNRQRRLSTAVHHDRPVGTMLRRSVSLEVQMEIGIGRTPDTWRPSYLLQRNVFSKGFVSVHGERPSAEYAKLRKESLESEFGHIVGTHSSKRVSVVYRFGPFLAFYRAAIISFHVLKLTIWRFFFRDIKERASKFRETLIRLGPFYVKLGQALSTRPDILPPVYCQELAKLQDQIPPFPTHVAIKSIENELGIPVSEIFADISPEPIAAASIGQVYKAHLHSGELVAVKVQRPGISLLLTLDALLFHMIGGQLKRFAKARKDLLVAVNEMVRHMFDEIDYILEARNAERFASLYSDCPIHGQTCNQNSKDGITNKTKNASGIKVPKIYWDLTRKAVLTMEWLDGIKLTDETALKKACLNQRELIDQGVYCSLRQLLDVGFFHADPHPGNLFATNSGFLAYLDFGMMGDIPRHYRVGLIQVLVHFVNRDSLGLANDFLSLGFIPEGVDIQSVADALQTSFGKGTQQSQDFQIAAISEQASESSEEPPKSEEKGSHPMGWKSFDMHAVVAATEDLLLFILSEKGQMVRVFLLRDIIRAADIFLQDEVMGCRLDAESKARKTSESEDDAIMRRVMNGFGSLKEAVKLGPEVWTLMFIRIALNPQTHRFFADVISALMMRLSKKFPDTFWVCMSTLIHRVAKSQPPHTPSHPIT
ncbi:hypothetical protein ERO13_D05G064700v2 [Gossypium hirsutum]|uniref:Uncharacterized protein slr1919 isoform X6 n=1 Tax=Gossypium hirsutum TaxID=3635 RepID=A0ABM3A2T7_GOSHI|nr:uncharacterized protein slr1919 isoform X6 [Gossypium hirsutum]KAG4144842.1 hypothetical protein ERO13_D05G064700v2 [Gossypium hirsutum]